MKDEFGRKTDTKLAKPSGRRLVKSNYDVRTWSSVTLSNIDIARIVQIMRYADLGEPADAITMFRRMVDTDGTLWSAINNRKLPILGAKWEILPERQDDAQAQAAAEMVRDQLMRVMDLETIFSALLEAWADGVAIAEIIWDGTDLKDIVPVPGEFMSWDLENATLELVLPEDDRWIGQTLSMQQSRNGLWRKSGKIVPLRKSKFIVHSPRLKSGPPHMRGAWRTIAAYWVIKHYCMQDWAAFTEVYGMPIRIGRYPSSATPEEVQILEDAIQNLGSDAAAVMPTGMAIDIEQPGAQIGANAGTVAFQKLIDYCDKEMTKLILGQTLTSDLTGNTGTYSSAKIHDEVRKDIVRADARALGRSLRKDLFEPLVHYNMPGAPVPRIVWDDLEDPQDEFVRAQTIEKLVRHMGVPVSKNQMYKIFKLDPPKDEEDTLLGRDFDDFNEEAQAKVDVAEIQAGAQIESTEMKTGSDSSESPGESSENEEPGEREEAMSVATRIIGSVNRANEDLANDLSAQTDYSGLWEAVTTLAGSGLEPEQIQYRMEMLYPELDTDDLEDLLARAMLSAFANGIQAVRKEGERGGRRSED